MAININRLEIIQQTMSEEVCARCQNYRKILLRIGTTRLWWAICPNCDRRIAKK